MEGSNDAKEEENRKSGRNINMVGPEYLGEGAIYNDMVAGSTAVKDLLEQNFLS